jgi:hypothetical protein
MVTQRRALSQRPFSFNRGLIFSAGMMIIVCLTSAMPTDMEDSFTPLAEGQEPLHQSVYPDSPDFYARQLREEEALRLEEEEEQRLEEEQRQKELDDDPEYVPEEEKAPKRRRGGGRRRFNHLTDKQVLVILTHGEMYFLLRKDCIVLSILPHFANT